MGDGWAGGLRGSLSGNHLRRVGALTATTVPRGSCRLPEQPIVTRQVIKLGSSSIASHDGLALDVIAGLVNQVAAARRAGHEIILVTSGAARLGRVTAGGSGRGGMGSKLEAAARATCCGVECIGAVAGGSG
jgi:glutamate 5-kinase